MRAAGVELVVDVRTIATIGIAEVVRRLPKFVKAYRALLAAARSRKPAAVILIDWPDFNMRLARRLHREGLKVIYYISPQIWAWRSYRVKALKRDVDHMLVILPFEVEFYKSHGVAAEYVGHPLAGVPQRSKTREQFCEEYDLEITRPIVSLLPGSRDSEVHHHLPLMLQAASLLTQSASKSADSVDGRGASTNSYGNARPQFVLPLASTIDRDEAERALSHHQSVGGPRVALAQRDTYNVLFNSDLAIIASGTATVEAALTGTPMVIVYRASELNWRLIRPLINVESFGMVNLIAGRKIAPELMQHGATPENIAREAREILFNPARSADMRRELQLVKERLCSEGSRGSDRAAEAVMKTIAPVDLGITRPAI